MAPLASAEAQDSLAARPCPVDLEPHGWMAGREVWGGDRVLCPLPVSAPSTCHCMQPEGTLPNCEKPRITPPPLPQTPHLPAPRLPYSCCQIDPVRLLAFSSGLSYLWAGAKAPTCRTGPGWCSVAPEPKIWAELARQPRALCLPALGAQCGLGTVALREWPAGACPEREGDLSSD